MGRIEGQLQGEGAAAEAINRYELILQSMTEGVSLSTEDGIIVYTNPAEDSMFGYGPGELIGQHVSVQNAYPDDVNAAVVEQVIEHLRRHGSWTGEWLNRRKDGTPFTTESRISAVEIGGRRHWLCVQRDVTAVREAESRFRQLADLVPAFVWFAEPDGRLTFLNHRWYEYTGQTEEEALPNGWAAVVHPGDAERVAARWEESRAREISYDVECRYRSAEGSYRWYVARAEPVRDRAGRVTAWFGTSTDIHDHKNAEDQLRDLAQRLDLAVSAHGIGIFDWHVPSGHLIWTAQEEELFGLPPRSFGGHISNWAESLVPEDRDEMNARMEAAMAARQDGLDFEFRIRRPDGEIRWIEGSSRLLYRADGTPERMVGTNMDVTERRRAEERQKLLVNELNHRVKNTLAIVQSIAQQSFRAVPDADGAREAFEARLSALSAAHNLLTRESWEAAPMRQVIADALRPYASDGRYSARGPELRLQPKTGVSLALALHELGTNAAKYGALSGEGGRVEIGWEAAEGRLRFTWREVGGPPVAPPKRRGFGTRLIERGLASDLGGEVRIQFHPDGVVCSIDAPLEA